MVTQFRSLVAPTGCGGSPAFHWQADRHIPDNLRPASTASVLLASSRRGTWRCTGLRTSNKQAAPPASQRAVVLFRSLFLTSNLGPVKRKRKGVRLKKNERGGASLVLHTLVRLVPGLGDRVAGADLVPHASVGETEILVREQRL